MYHTLSCLAFESFRSQLLFGLFKFLKKLKEHLMSLVKKHLFLTSSAVNPKRSFRFESVSEDAFVLKLFFNFKYENSQTTAVCNKIPL